MCRYLDNDMVLGNLFIKIIEREKNEITFEKIYDFIYYASIKLNEVENTNILVSRDGIMSFARLYQEFIQVDEEENKIVISPKEAPRMCVCFRNRYEESGKDFAASFDYAFDQIAV